MKRKSTYIRILISLLILGIVIVFSLSTVIMVSAERYSRKLLMESDRKILEQIAFSTNYIDNSAKVFAMALFSDSTLKRLLQKDSPDLQEAIKIMNSLRTQVNGSSIVDSVYIYNRDSSWIYSTKHKLSQSLKGFFDSDMEDMIRKNELPERLSPIPRKIPHTEGQPTVNINVFTYILPLYPFSNEIFPSALIVNIDATFLMDIIDQMKGRASEEIIVIDRLGKVIAHSDKNLFLTPLPDRYKEIVVKLDDRQSGRFTIDEEDLLATVFFSEKSDWEFIKISNYRDVMNPIIKLRFLLIAIGLAFIGVVWILSFLFSRNLYKPIRDLVKHIEQKSLSAAPEIEQQGELDFIAAVFSETVEKTAYLKKFKNKNMKVLKTQLFRELVFGRVTDFDETGRRLADLNCAMDDKSYFRLLLIQLDFDRKKTKMTISGNEMNMLLQSVAAIMSEIALDPDYSEAMTLEENRILIIAGNPKPLQKEQMYDIHKKVINDIVQMFPCLVTSALSSEGEGIRTLHEQYLETMELINYRLISGPETMITIDDVEEEIDETLPFPLKEEKKLIESIKEIDNALCNRHFANLSNIIKKFSYEKIRLGYMRTASSVFDYLNSIESYSSESFHFRFSQFAGELNSCAFVSDIETLFTELIQSICDYLNKSTGNKSRQNIEAVKNFIEMDFTDPALNLATVAARMRMSPVYLGRVFKQGTSLSFNRYLTVIRLKTAAELLKETDKTIEAISTEVGISNTRFFFTKFKSEYGVTPTQFRKKQYNDK